MACELCDDVTKTGELVFEDAFTFVVLHNDWSPRGHAMVVAKRHVENASDLDEDELLHIARVWHRTERVLLEVTGAERAIIFKLGVFTPHLHLHIYPVAATATRDDVFAAINGKASADRDEPFIERVRVLLTAPPH